MSSDAPGDDALLRSYLLGELAEKEADALKIRLLKDDALFEEAEAVEGDLFAAFAHGDPELSGRRDKIRKLAMSRRSGERYALAAGLDTLANSGVRKQRPQPLPFRKKTSLAQRPAVRWAAMAAAGLILAAGGAWLAIHPADKAVDSRNEAAPIVRNVAKPTPPRQEVLPATPTPDMTASTKAPAVVKPRAEKLPHRQALAPLVFELALSTTRGGEQPRSVMTIPAGTQRVEILLLLNEGLRDSFQSYHAAVQDATSGSEIWSQETLKPREGKDGAMVVLSLPASKLPEGQYLVDLQGLTEGGKSEPAAIKSFEVKHMSSNQ